MLDQRGGKRWIASGCGSWKTDHSDSSREAQRNGMKIGER